MPCSDCHGNNVATAGSSAPDANRPWGPHGSANIFILKAPLSGNTGTGATGDLCFKCHSTNYATSGATAQSGFCCDKSTNLHEYHVNKIRSPMECTWCHVAVPHGWKDKALLANTDNVGPEVGLAPGTSVVYTNNKGYTKGPYYLNAFLRVINWKASGDWTVADCNGGSVSGSLQAGGLDLLPPAYRERRALTEDCTLAEIPYGDWLIVDAANRVRGLGGELFAIVLDDMARGGYLYWYGRTGVPDNRELYEKLYRRKGRAELIGEWEDGPVTRIGFLGDLRGSSTSPSST